MNSDSESAPGNGALVSSAGERLLPDVADGVEYELEPGWITLAYQTTAISLLKSTPILVVAIFLALSFAPVPDPIRPLLWPLLILKLLFNIVKGAAIPRIAYRHSRYKVDENGLQIRGGVFNRVTTSVPRSRVQHIDIAQGFLERRLGLASLIIHTAAAGDSAVLLEGITPEKAALIRDYLLPRATDATI